MAVHLRRLEVVKLLLEEGADAMAVSDKKETPLQIAVQHANAVIVCLLLEYLTLNTTPERLKKYINAQNKVYRDKFVVLLIQVTFYTLKDGLTALHMAADLTSDQLHANKEDSQIMALLIQFGGQVTVESQVVRHPVQCSM